MNTTDSSRGFRVAVIGHTGFVGTAIRTHLENRSMTVIPLASRDCNLLETSAPDRLREMIPAGSSVIFCSAITRVLRDDFETLQQNLRMAESLVRSAVGGRYAQVIYLSSTDVYGHHPPTPIRETTPPAPENYYGLAKLVGEHLLRLSGGPGCSVSVLRLPGMYGPGDGDRSVIGRLAGAMRRGSVTIHGTGEVLRDYVHVDDVCALVEHLLLHPVDGVFNVATGRSLSIKELVRRLAQELRLTPRIDHAGPEPNRAEDQVFDISYLRASFPDLSISPLDEGLSKYAASLRLFGDLT